MQRVLMRRSGSPPKFPAPKSARLRFVQSETFLGFRLAPNQLASAGYRLQRHDRHDERKESEMQLQPYLFFEGRCEEAARFYEKAVGDRMERVVPVSAAPPP